MTHDTIIKRVRLPAQYLQYFERDYQKTSWADPPKVQAPMPTLTNSVSGFDGGTQNSIQRDCSRELVPYWRMSRRLEVEIHHRPLMSMYYKVMWDSLPRETQIGHHLCEMLPGRPWKSYLHEISGFAVYCNSIRELYQKSMVGNAFKWGATACIQRRWFTLNLQKGYHRLYFVVTYSVQESASLEKSFIALSKSCENPLIRGPCENGSVGGEGLGKDSENLAASQGHFFYCAVAQHR